MAEGQVEHQTPRGGGETILRTSGLSKRFGNITAVHSLDLDVRAGEVLGFLGPNGSGKSTTVGMILGLIEPTAGTVELFGKPLAQQREVLTRQVGAIIETPAFYPYITGRDNLRALAMAAGGVPAGRVEELLTLVGLQERAGGKYKTYSLGMKQRLGIASTLLTNPSLVILDEPTNGLDPAGQREIRDLIPDLARQGHAVLLASHLLHEVEQVCERVAIIRSGRLIEFGRVADLVARGGYLDVKLRPNEIAAAVQVLQTLAVRRERGAARRRPGRDLHRRLRRGDQPGAGRAGHLRLGADPEAVLAGGHFPGADRRQHPGRAERADGRVGRCCRCCVARFSGCAGGGWRRSSCSSSCSASPPSTSSCGWSTSTPPVSTRQIKAEIWV